MAIFNSYVKLPEGNYNKTLQDVGDFISSAHIRICVSRNLKSRHVFWDALSKLSGQILMVNPSRSRPNLGETNQLVTAQDHPRSLWVIGWNPWSTPVYFEIAWIYGCSPEI